MDTDAYLAARAAPDGGGGLVAVTGANGFVGRAICARIRAGGGRVRAIQRQAAGVDADDYRQIDDLLTADLASLIDGCTAVVHCAARVHVTGRESLATADQAYHAMNTDLPVRLATAARRAGVARFIQLSSVAAIRSHSHAGETVDDATSPEPQSPYGRAKLAADVALAALSDDRMPILSLRPPAIYGPGVGAFFALLMKAARRGLPLPVGGIANRRNFVFVDNVADAVARALVVPHQGAFILTDSPPIATATLYRALLSHYGHGDRVWAWPRAMVAMAAKLALRERASSFIGDAAYSGERFVALMDWQAPVDQATALRRTVEGR